MCIQLSNGEIYKIFNGPNLESPIFQVLAIRPIHSGNRDNFYLILSDGTHYSSCFIVGTQLNLVVEKITPYSIIRVNRYVCNIIENGKVVIILDLDVLHLGEENDGIIGNPIRYKIPVEQGFSGSYSRNSQNSTEISKKFDGPASLQYGITGNSSLSSSDEDLSCDLFPTQMSSQPASLQFEISGNSASRNSEGSSGVLFSTEMFSQPAPLECGISGNSASSNSEGSSGALFSREMFSQPASLQYGISGNSASRNSEGSSGVLFSREMFSPPGTSSSSQRSSFSGRPSVLTVGLQSIRNLTPFLNSWTIRARVTNKSMKIEDFNGGVRFFFFLLDESGEIRATAFDEQCNKFYNMIKVGEVYYITQSIVKDSKKAFNPMNHDYEINFDCRTQVQFCEEKTEIPMERFRFVSISEIGTINPGMLIDIIGICKGISEIEMTQGLRKIDVQIVDDSQTEVRVTLWEIQAINFNGTLGSVIAIKGAKVSEFRGRSLSIATSQIVEINPNIEEADNLRAWYENGGCNMPTYNLTEDHWNSESNN